jgi:phosphoribulokinase
MLQCMATRANLTQTQVQTNSNLIQTISNFDHPTNDLPELQQFEIKYSFEGLEKMNKFLHKNLFRFGGDFE